MPASWLIAMAWIAITIAFLSAAVILTDIYGHGYRLKMPIMEAVWPVTALYVGPVAIWAHWRFGRTTSSKWLDEHQLSEPPAKPGWAAIATGVSHCGAGCTLGDIAAEFAVFGLGLTVAGTALPFEYLGDYILAIALGLIFQPGSTA